MINYSDTICNLQKRQYSAKGAKFLNQCIDIAIKKRGYSHRLQPGAREIMEKIKELIGFLIFDELKTIPEIKEIIKNRIEKNTLN